jgi:hypothetical protein
VVVRGNSYTQPQYFLLVSSMWSDRDFKSSAVSPISRRSHSDNSLAHDAPRHAAFNASNH